MMATKSQNQSRASRERPPVWPAKQGACVSARDALVDAAREREVEAVACDEQADIDVALPVPCEHCERVGAGGAQEAMRERASLRAVNVEQHERGPHQAVCQQAAVGDEAAHHAAVAECKTGEQCGESCA